MFKIDCIILWIPAFFWLSINSSYGQISPNFYEVASGFQDPVVISHAGDGSHRMFICEQKGVIKIIKDPGSGIVLSSPFLDIQNRVKSGGEQGLLGMAFHPRYPDSPYFFVNYIFDPLSGLDRTRISRFEVSSDPNLANINSEKILLEINQPYGNHNGGDLHFGPDGYLYIALGDGGSQLDPQNNAQDGMSLLGSILRIDVNQDDFPLESTRNYGIPPDNPFLMNINVKDEIWAMGLRNPWRFSFDHLTGGMYIADVGQGSWEEINYQPATSTGGENYGWSCKEGNSTPNNNLCIAGPLSDPVFQYSHTQGCSVTGGYVYRGSSFADFVGKYFFADYCSSVMWILDSVGGWTAQEYDMSNFPNLATFGISESNELYVSSIRTGNDKIYRVFDDNICKDSLLLNTVVQNTYLANNSIRSNASLLPGDTIIFSAGDNIFLDPAFDVTTGSQLIIDTLGCQEYILTVNY